MWPVEMAERALFWLQFWQHCSASKAAYPFKWDYHDSWEIVISWSLSEKSCYREEVSGYCCWMCTLLSSEYYTSKEFW